MASSLNRRLLDIFSKTTKPQVLTAVAGDKPKVPTPEEAIITPESVKEQKVRSLIRKFKHSSKKPRFRRHYLNYESFVRQLIRIQHFSAIEEILEHQKSYPEIKTESFVVRLILLYSKAGMFDHAQKLFDEMPELNCERTVISFNALLAACVNSKNYDKVSEIFNELPGKLAIEPNVVSYNTVIKAFCELGSLDSAVTVLHEMGKNGIEPNVITFNTILDTFYKNNRFAEAEKIWSLMETMNVIPDIRSYNSRLRGLIGCNQVVEADDFFEEMRKREVKPDTHSHNAMITAFAKDGNLELAKSWYAKLVENGCVPDHVTFGLLVPLACDNDDPHFAYELCKKSIRVKRNVFSNTMQQAIDSLVDHSMIEEAKELVEMGKKCSFRYKLTLPDDA